jgi:hypothetical protein
VIIFSGMERRVKRVLYQNDIREHVMDSEKTKIITHVREWTNNSQAPLREVLPLHSLQAQTFLPAAQKMRIMLVMWQDNGHKPVCGHCPLNPKTV